MQGITSINELNEMVQSNENVWLLLFKSGSEQSDCAYTSFGKARKENENDILCVADVNSVRDIHPAYNITSVPTLMHFEKGGLKNIVKGCHKPEQFNAIFRKMAYVAAGGDNETPAKNVTVYTTPTCSWCTTIKRHLDSNGVRYREIDVAADQKAAEEMMRKSGQQGVPQTEINGQMIVGFDKTRINSLLGIN